MSGVLFRVDENTLDGLEKNLSVLREPERKAEVLANILQTLFYEIRESWKERDAARAECEKLRKALDESLLFLDSAAQASPLIPSTLVRIVESVRGTLRNALAKETP